MDISTWISVLDALPDDDRLEVNGEYWPYVLAVWKKRTELHLPGFVVESLWYHGKFYANGIDSDHKIFCVTEWTYLPEPPKEYVASSLTGIIDES